MSNVFGDDEAPAAKPKPAAGATGPTGIGPDNMRLVESSLVHSWAYARDNTPPPDTKGTLWIRFQHQRKLYRYDNVPEHVVNSMAQAPSIGGFVTRSILKQYKGALIEEKT